MEGIGQRLKELIEEKELTLLAFSEKVGIQRSSLSHLFSGRNKPSIDLLLKIKHQFPDADLEWLITGKQHNARLNINKEELEIANSDEQSDVTYVTSGVVTPDNHNIRSIETKNEMDINTNAEIERIVLFFKDGSFKEHKNT